MSADTRNGYCCYSSFFSLFNLLAFAVGLTLGQKKKKKERRYNKKLVKLISFSLYIPLSPAHPVRPIEKENLQLLAAAAECFSSFPFLSLTQPVEPTLLPSPDSVQSG